VSYKLSLLKKLKSGYNIIIAVITCGCTKFLQAPDVCSNKPFKDHLHECYDAWMAGDENKEFTKGGNLKAPSFELMLSWVNDAWQMLDTELIKKSFIVCGQTSGNAG